LLFRGVFQKRGEGTMGERGVSDRPVCSTPFRDEKLDHVYRGGESSV